ncbi:hypothetical protein CRV24_001441 [Beauveria bassiana]|uniref:Uncharacterized protein n=1 Tax=Beauveria bassiana (strain ARSEF 2860) TaxID=655819 RepID=J5JBP6_BEAB2|nr:uncharacterized protein BBA_07444 [Beauveria bassiana ARSEF 2860]EJP63518.1 hypothetical protein BBA_07444 [Beauveria bassiana ARSEF 2860]KAF1739506.1 hypothetical protein CRV24_001441 [Beauveria bassiana]KAH8719966.1 hypothetical protein HC256_000373 [Beauveria bassiana]
MAFFERVAPLLSTDHLVSGTGSSGSELAVPNDDQPVANTQSIEDTDEWVLPENGVCDFLPIQQLSRIQVLFSNDTHRLFRAIWRQPEDQADLSLTWGEAKGAGIVVWSYFVSKTKYVIMGNGEIVRSKPKGTKFDQTTGRVKYRHLVPNDRTMDREMHNEIGRNIKKACSEASGRFRALGFTRVVEGECSYKEMTWQIRLQPADDANTELAALMDCVPH